VTGYRWNVRKRDGLWHVYRDWSRWDTHTTLPEAHTAATQCAVMDELCKPGGLTKLADIIWAAKDYDRKYYGFYD
jgi:hypothetical protein